MKNMILLLLLAATTTVQAQFLGGFFSQQATQRKLMAEQITGWQVYLRALKTGYHITENGLTTAHDLKNGTFSLHSSYFNSLEQVSPTVQNNPKGKVCTEIASQISLTLNSEINWQQKTNMLSPKEMTYLQKVSAGVRADCKAGLQQLDDILTPGKLQLSDAERLTQIDKVYTSLKEKQIFSVAFSARCRKLAMARQRAKIDNEQIRKLYGINH